MCGQLMRTVSHHVKNSYMYVCSDVVSEVNLRLKDLDVEALSVSYKI